MTESPEPIQLCVFWTTTRPCVWRARGWRGLAGAAFNAAKDVALDRFIEGRIGCTTMAPLVEATLARVSTLASLAKAASGLEDVLAMDQFARREAVEVARVMVRQA